MRVIVINPWNQSIAAADHNGNYRDYYRLLSGPTLEGFPDAEVSCFDIVRLEGTGHLMFVDDEGMIGGGPQAYFQLGADHRPYAGRAVIAADGGEDESCCTLSIEEVRLMVGWLPIGTEVTPPQPVVQSFSSFEDMLAALAEPSPIGPHEIELPE